MLANMDQFHSTFLVFLILGYSTLMVPFRTSNFLFLFSSFGILTIICSPFRLPVLAGTYSARVSDAGCFRDISVTVTNPLRNNHLSSFTFILIKLIVIIQPLATHLLHGIILHVLTPTMEAFLYLLPMELLLTYHYSTRFSKYFKSDIYNYI